MSESARARIFKNLRLALFVKLLQQTVQTINERRNEESLRLKFSLMKEFGQIKQLQAYSLQHFEASGFDWHK